MKIQALWDNIYIIELLSYHRAKYAFWIHVIHMDVLKGTDGNWYNR
jgi:hypothetical protein